MTDMDRRTLIGAACLGCATLAGCGSSDSGTASSPASSSSASSAAPGSPGTSSAAPSSAPSSSAAPSATASAGGAPAAAGLATLSAIPVGSAVAVKGADGKPLIVARPTETTAVAFSARCTHAGCSVVVAGGKLNCPCHGSVFEAATGKVLKPPARAPLPSVPVKVVGDQVVKA